MKVTPLHLIPELGLKQRNITTDNFGWVPSHLGTSWEMRGYAVTISGSWSRGGLSYQRFQHITSQGGFPGSRRPHQLDPKLPHEFESLREPGSGQPLPGL